MRELEQFPRVKLGVLPTPIHRLEGISEMLGTNIYVKRDDLTGLGLGGNKVRKLEFLLADAREKGAEVVFTTGGAQSNHAMLTAAAANKLGMKAILILKKRGVTERKGNVLLEHLLGTDVRFMDTDDYQDIYDEMDRVGQELGVPYYKIPVGGSNSLGSLGYVSCVREIRNQGIRFDAVIDEGGAITEGQIPGVKCKSAVVAVHEKSRHLFRCKAELDTKGHGGFGGSKDSAIERLSRFIAEVSDKKDKIYKGTFYPEVRATFERHVPYMAFPMNVLFGNIGLFAPVIKKIMMGIPAASAMLSTGLSFTTITAGDTRDPQIKAKAAESTLFLRCVREEDLYEGLKTIRKIGEKYGVTVEEIARDYCQPTDFQGEAYKTVEALLHENFPDVAVVPFLLTAGTDARHFTDVADNILRFAPIDLSKKQFATIHAADEHIGIENIGQCVVFYKDLVRRF